MRSTDEVADIPLTTSDTGTSRVLICSDSFYPARGGGILTMRCYAKAIKRAGYLVSTLYFGEENDPEFDSHPISSAALTLRGMWPRQWAASAPWRTALRKLLHCTRPDVVLAQQTVIGPTVETCHTEGIPVVALVNSVDPFCLGSFWSGHPWKCQQKCIGCRDSGPRLAQYPFFLPVARHTVRSLRKASTVVANSHFTASVTRLITGLQADIINPPLPSVTAAPLVRESGDILFVSPVVHKGLDIALGLARAIPEEHFVFIGESKRLARRLIGLDNVTTIDWTRGMSKQYSEAKLVLVPSIVPEGFGRVCVEAMQHGVPCAVSGVGALPETIGDGGDVVEAHRDLDSWISVVKLYGDSTYVRRKSEKAIACAQRYPGPEVSEGRILEIISRTGSFKHPTPV